jgi:hypothetical protein
VPELSTQHLWPPHNSTFLRRTGPSHQYTTHSSSLNHTLHCCLRYRYKKDSTFLRTTGMPADMHRGLVAYHECYHNQKLLSIHPSLRHTTSTLDRPSLTSRWRCLQLSVPSGLGRIQGQASPIGP